MSVSAPPRFERSYADELPELNVDWQPDPLSAPQLLIYNDALAAELGLERGALGRDGVYDVNVGLLRRLSASNDVIKARLDDGEDPIAVLRDVSGIDSLSAEEQAEIAAGSDDMFGTGVVGILNNIISN